MKVGLNIFRPESLDLALKQARVLIEDAENVRLCYIYERTLVPFDKSQAGQT